MSCTKSCMGDRSLFGSQSFSPYSNAQGLNQDGCNGDVMRTRRKNTVSCCTAQEKEEKVKGRSREQLHLQGRLLPAAPRHSWAGAGLQQHSAVANEASAQSDSPHLLPLVSACQAPGSTMHGAALPCIQVHPARATCAALGTPWAFLGHL